MPIVCVNRPNRTKARVFTAKDVRRIAKYAVDDGADAAEIFAGVGVSLGLGYLLCIAARAVDNSVKIMRLVAKIGGVFAVGKVLDFLLTVLSRGLYRKLPVTNRIALLVVLALTVTESILKAAKQLFTDADIITGGAVEIHKLCSKAKEIAIVSGENLGDRYKDAGDIIERELDNFNIPIS